MNLAGKKNSEANLDLLEKSPKNPFIDSRAESMSNFKSMGTAKDEDFRRKRIVQTLQNLNICPATLEKKNVNWLAVAKKINTSNFLMRVAQHKAVSPVEIYQTYLKHFKCLEYLEKWSA